MEIIEGTSVLHNMVSPSVRCSQKDVVTFRFLPTANSWKDRTRTVCYRYNPHSNDFNNRVFL